MKTEELDFLREKNPFTQQKTRQSVLLHTVKHTHNNFKNTQNPTTSTTSKQEKKNALRNLDLDDQRKVAIICAHVYVILTSSLRRNPRQSGIQIRYRQSNLLHGWLDIVRNFDRRMCPPKLEAISRSTVSPPKLILKIHKAE